MTLMRLLFFFTSSLASITISCAQSLTVNNLNFTAFPIIKADMVVRDGQGNQIHDLQPSDFTITINGLVSSPTIVDCPSNQTTNPVNIVLVNDRSESMNEVYNGGQGSGIRMELVILGGKALIASLDFRYTSVAITAFSNVAQIKRNFTTNAQSLIQAIGDLTPDTTLGTYYMAAFLDPAAGAIPLVAEADPSRVIIFLTDGQPTDNFYPDLVIQEAVKRNIHIFPITVDTPMNPALQQIANATGGKAFANANTEDKIVRVYQEIANSIKSDLPCNISWRAGMCDAADAQTAVITYKPLNLKTSVTYSIKGLLHLPTVNAGTDRSICKGQSTTLSIASPEKGTYLWSPAATLDDPTSSAPVATPGVTTLYSVLFTDANGCSASDSVLVSVDDPHLSVQRNLTICKGSSITFTVDGNGTSYLWSPATDLDNPTLKTPTASPQQTTTYKVTMKLNNCTLTDSVTVTVISGNGTLDAGKDASICAGGSVQLDAIGLSTGVYQWIPVEGLDNPDIHNPIASPNQTTMYHVTLLGQGDCQQTLVDSVLVVVNPLPTMTITGGGSICPGQSLVLEALGSAGDYAWTPVEGVDNPDAATTVVHPKQTTMYHLKLTTKEGCSTEDSVLVKVQNLLTVKASATAEGICPGGSLQISASGNESGDILWSPAEGVEDSHAAVTIVHPKQTTMYHVRLTSEGGCPAEDSVLVQVYPAASVSAGADTSICPGDIARLHAVTSGKGSYVWTPAEGLSATDIADPVAQPQKDQMYHVEFTNEQGCQAQDSVMVSIREKSVVEFSLRDIPNRGYLPGEDVPVSLYIDNSDHQAEISFFRVELAYDMQGLQYKAGSIQSTVSGWAITAQEDAVSGHLVISGSGTGAIGGKVCSLTVRIFLSAQDAEHVPLKFALTSIEPHQCFDTKTTDAEITLKTFCAQDLRLVKFIRYQYALHQNEPNPAAEETTIPYSIGLPAPATLTIYNSMGTEVGVFTSGVQDPGVYRIHIDTHSFTPGLYFYRLVSGSYSASRQFVIVR